MLMISLDTPYVVDARLDPNGPYTHACIGGVNDRCMARCCELVVMIGWLDGSNNFHVGVGTGEDVGMVRSCYSISGADHACLMEETAQGTDPNVATALRRAQYQWLIDNGHFPGTIMDVVQA